MRFYPKNIKVLVFFMFLLTTACRRDAFDDQIPFITTIEVPAGLGATLTYNFPIPSINGTNLNINAARPNQIQLYIEQGEANFDFVRQAFLLIETDSSQIEIGYQLDQRIDNRSTMTLLPNIVDIKEYISQPNFRMLLKLNLRYPTVSTSRIRVELGVGINYE
jgi:hypothetical protein